MSDIQAAAFVVACCAAAVFRKGVASWFHWLFTAYRRQYATAVEHGLLRDVAMGKIKAMDQRLAAVEAAMSNLLGLAASVNGLHDIVSHCATVERLAFLEQSLADLRADMEGKGRPAARPRGWRATLRDIDEAQAGVIPQEVIRG